MEPKRVLIVGCGLIGSSIALAVQSAHAGTLVDGVEPSHRHQRDAAGLGAFRHVFESLPDEMYDLAILAVPVDVACALLKQVTTRATVVVDVCSVKQPICDEAVKLGLHQGQFCPSHPMAGNAGTGPLAATGDLFAQQPWILFEEWEGSASVAAWLSSLGARIEWVRSPQEHDAAMAAVSHGIHLMSLTAMLTSEQQERTFTDMGWSHLTGPGFRDITRLAQSGHDFWLTTLLQNRTSVSAYLKQAQAVLSQFQESLDTSDAKGLRKLLEDAKAAKERWTQ